MMIYTEVTPNPASLKFVTDRVLIHNGNLDFPNVDSSAEAPLAAKLFELNYVQGVFIGHNFITVSKAEDKKWEEIIPTLKSTLKAYLESGEPIVLNAPEASTEEDSEESDPVIRRIKQLLNDNIRPAVAMDGGDISFESFEEGTVRLKLKGSCAGCPSSTMTLKMGIEGLLTRMVPEVKTVEAV